MYVYIQIAHLSNSTVSTSWEIASKVSVDLIEDYEKGVLCDIAESFTSGGQTIHTAYLNSTNRSSSNGSQEDTTCPPPPKKLQIDDVNIINKLDNGYVTVIMYICIQYITYATLHGRQKAHITTKLLASAETL